MSLLHALKMMVFRSIESVIKHEVFVQGVEVALDVPRDPASILQEVDSLRACTGAGLSAEFPLACSNANSKQWNDTWYHIRCKGVSSQSEKCCVSCKYLRRLLVNQRCQAKQTKMTRRNTSTKLRA